MTTKLFWALLFFIRLFLSTAKQSATTFFYCLLVALVVGPSNEEPFEIDYFAATYGHLFHDTDFGYVYKPSKNDSESDFDKDVVGDSLSPNLSFVSRWSLTLMLFPVNSLWHTVNLIAWCPTYSNVSVCFYDAVEMIFYILLNRVFFVDVQFSFQVPD